MYHTCLAVGAEADEHFEHQRGSLLHREPDVLESESKHAGEVGIGVRGGGRGDK